MPHETRFIRGMNSSLHTFVAPLWA